MADLKILESKLAEVLGLASAAQDATKKVEGMLDDGEQDLARVLQQMRDQAAETEDRCTDAGLERQEDRGPRKGSASEMMETYLAGEREALDGFES